MQFIIDLDYLHVTMIYFQLFAGNQAVTPVLFFRHFKIARIGFAFTSILS